MANSVVLVVHKRQVRGLGGTNFIEGTINGMAKSGHLRFRPTSNSTKPTWILFGILGDAC